MYEIAGPSRNSNRNQNVLSEDFNIRRSQKDRLDYEEPERCTCCFTLRGIAISSISILVVVVALILILNFTILEVRRAQIQRSKYELIQDGGILVTDSIWENKNLWELKILDLKEVEINASNLARIIEVGYEREVIRLQNLTLKGKLASAQYGPYQSALKEFLFELNQPIGPSHDFQLDDCDECIADSSDLNLDGIRQIHCLPPLMFYINTHVTPEKTRLLQPMTRVNISISVFGRKLLTIRPQSKELVTMFRNCEDPIRLLLDSNNAFQFQKLGFSSCINLNVTNLTTWLTSWNVTHLTLDRVRIIGMTHGQRLSQIFENATSLQHLVIKTGPFRKINLTNPEKNFDDTQQVMFQEFPKSLKTLVLSGVVILSNDDEVTSTTAKQDLQLDSLMLNQVSFQQIRTFNTFPQGIQFQKMAFRQLSILAQGSAQDHDYVKNEEDMNSRSLAFIGRVMEKANWLWLENPFYRFNEIHEIIVGRLSPDSGLSNVREMVRNVLQRELMSWRLWISKKGIDDTILLKQYPAFNLVKNGGTRGQGSWKFVSGEKNWSRKDNAEVWFRFLEMETFLKEYLWEQIEW